MSIFPCICTLELIKGGNYVLVHFNLLELSPVESGQSVFPTKIFKIFSVEKNVMLYFRVPGTGIICPNMEFIHPRNIFGDTFCVPVPVLGL